MNAFQLLGISLLVTLVAVTIAAARRSYLGWPASVGWVCVWTAAATAIAIPESTMIVAHALGIDRGADLVFYCSILAMLAGFFVVFVRFRRLEQDLTRIVRHAAIRDALDSDRPGLDRQDDGGR
jgi:hypothetical protein